MYSENETENLNDKIDSIVFANKYASEDESKYISFYVSGLIQHQALLAGITGPKRSGHNQRCPWCNSTICKMDVPMSKGEVVYYRCMNPLCLCEIYATHRYEYVESKRAQERRLPFVSGSFSNLRSILQHRRTVSEEEYAERTTPLIDSINQAAHLLNSSLLEAARLIGVGDLGGWEKLLDCASLHKKLMNRNLRYWGAIIPYTKASDFHVCYQAYLEKQQDFARILVDAALSHDISLINRATELSNTFENDYRKCLELLPE